MKTENLEWLVSNALHGDISGDNSNDLQVMIKAEQEFNALLASHNALELTVKNIKVHFGMLCTHELRQHGFVSPDHDIDFQVFRVLCGYKELMDSHTALVEAVDKVVTMYRKGEGHVCTHYPNGRRALDALAALVGDTGRRCKADEGDDSDYDFGLELPS